MKLCVCSHVIVAHVVMGHYRIDTMVSKLKKRTRARRKVMGCREAQPHDNEEADISWDPVCFECSDSDE